MDKEKTKETKTKENKKFSVFEFKIDKKYFPKNRGNHAFDHGKKQSNILRQLHDLELELIFSELKIKNIFDVLFGKTRKERPTNMLYIHDLNREISEFNTKYDNYCLRIFIYREIISTFTSEFLKLEVDKYWDVMRDSKVVSLKISNLLKKFDSGVLKDVISYRNKLTHKIEFSTEKQKKEQSKKEVLLKELAQKNQNVKKSLNEILKIKLELEKKLLSQFK